MLNIIQ